MSSKMTQDLQLCYRCFTAASDCCESEADECSSDTLTRNIASSESLQEQETVGNRSSEEGRPRSVITTADWRRVELGLLEKLKT